jgi:hypothetical protein
MAIRLNFLELAEEILDQMAPFVHLGVDRQGRTATRMLGDHGLGAALIEIGDDGVAVEGHIGDQGTEGDTIKPKVES